MDKILVEGLIDGVASVVIVLMCLWMQLRPLNKSENSTETKSFNTPLHFAPPRNSRTNMKGLKDVGQKPTRASHQHQHCISSDL